MDNILDMLIEYSKQGMMIDRNFIIKVVNILVKDKNLEEYVKNLRFFHEKEVSIGSIVMCYKDCEKQICVCENMVEAWYNMVLNECKILGFSKFEQILAGNAFILCHILHEIEHANQVKKSTISNGDLESQILSICNYTFNKFLNYNALVLRIFKYLNTRLIKYYNLNLELNTRYGLSAPNERMARIYQYTDIIELLKKMGEHLAILVNYFNTKLNSAYLHGYDFNVTSPIIPTIAYLEDYKSLNIPNTGDYIDNIFKNIEQMKEEALERRLLLGLPITEEEYTKTKMLGKENLFY